MLFFVLRQHLLILSDEVFKLDCESVGLVRRISTHLVYVSTGALSFYGLLWKLTYIQR